MDRLFPQRQWQEWRSAQPHFDQFAAGMQEPLNWGIGSSLYYYAVDPDNPSVWWQIELRGHDWFWFTIEQRFDAKPSREVGPFSTIEEAIANCEIARRQTHEVAHK